MLARYRQLSNAQPKMPGNFRIEMRQYQLFFLTGYRFEISCCFHKSGLLTAYLHRHARSGQRGKAVNWPQIAWSVCGSSQPRNPFNSALANAGVPQELRM